MNTITIKNDKDFSKLKKSYKEYTRIGIVGELSEINFTPDNAYYVVYGSAVIKHVYDSAVIKYVHGSAVIKYVHDSAVIQDVYGSAVIKFVGGFASVLSIKDYASVTAKGNTILRIIGKQPNIKIKVKKTVHVIREKEQVKNIDWFVGNYPVKEKGKTKLILYKAVHKKDKKYISDYDNSFEYKIGETMKEELAERNEGSCASGIHVSHKFWAIQFGRGWEDLAILECEVNKKDIVVADDCDGKVRASKVKIIREVPESDY